MENIKVGDVVILKSGGPKMTVNTINNDNSLTCCWFDKNEAIQFAYFFAETLRKYRP